MYLIFLLILFLSLFLLSRVLTATISLFFLRVTQSYTFAIQILALLFLPGVIIHELAHWLVASMLFVPTGEIEFLPQVQGDSVKLGSVQVAKTDLIRRFAIGVAPVILGIAVLLGCFWLLSPSFSPFTWKTLVFFYIVFEIGNTMFSSKKDLEGVIEFALLLFLLVSLLFFLKIPIFIFLTTLIVSPITQSFSEKLVLFFLIAVSIDMSSIGFLYFLMKILRK